MIRPFLVFPVCTISISRSLFGNSMSLNYKSIMMTNETCKVFRMMPQLGVSLTDDSRSIIYNCNMFMIHTIRYKCYITEGIGSVQLTS